MLLGLHLWRIEVLWGGKGNSKQHRRRVCRVGTCEPHKGAKQGSAESGSFTSRAFCLHTLLMTCMWRWSIEGTE